MSVYLFRKYFPFYVFCENTKACVDSFPWINISGLFFLQFQSRSTLHRDFYKICDTIKTSRAVITLAHGYRGSDKFVALIRVAFDFSVQRVQRRRFVLQNYCFREENAAEVEEEEEETSQHLNRLLQRIVNHLARERWFLERRTFIILSSYTSRGGP